MRKTKSAVIFLLIAASLFQTAFLKKIKTPETLFLDSTDARQSAAYQKVLTAAESAKEQAKWKYLVERIRQSPKMFVRNGEVFKGSKAAHHFLWKLSRRGRIVNTAEEFIDKVASKSFSSGSAYLVQETDKETYPLRDILKNELRRLELYLQEDAKG